MCVSFLWPRGIICIQFFAVYDGLALARHKYGKNLHLFQEWNEKAAENAQKWANQCKMSISPNKQRVLDGIFCGENIFQSNYPSTWSDAIQVWYNKASNFKYGVGAIDPNKSIAGYTQVVWYNSYKIGCGLAYCPQSTFPYLYVCQYCPTGNLVDKMAKPYKEGPACGDCPNACDNGLCTNPCQYVDHYTNCEELKRLFHCESDMMKQRCQATCSCTSEIK
uniref:ShKT domain-containing protein n=1 Tax=Sphenodon punctatus TaxID=8508 RepID=A0A8D0GHP4_SPHPU